MTGTLEKVQAYIFDLDGTLYSQKKMHIKMAEELIRYYAIHPNRIKDIYYIWKFRKLREYRDNKQISINELIGKMSSSEDKIKNIYGVIDRWMFKEPLKLIKSCAYEEVINYIRKEKDKGKSIVIYSDYPVKDKLNALGLCADIEVCAEDDNIKELKPSSKAMNYIMDRLNADGSLVVYVGDRYEKDGESARLSGVVYYDIHQFRKIIVTGEDNGQS